MSGRSAWDKEIDEAVRHENWCLHGADRVVKVVRRLPTGIRTMQSLGYTAPPGRLGGYITVASAINKCTPQDIEFRLGLPIGELADGALIYRFLRLPSISEYEYELTAKYPDGLAYNAAMSDERYQPGSGKVHQWRIKEGSEIPVDTKNVVTLLPGQRYEAIR